MIIDDFCLPVISIFLIIETIAITKLISNIKAYKKALPIIVKKIADLNEGVSAIQGRIIALEPLLISPYTQKPCVYYSFNVEQKMKRGRGIGWWANLVSEKRYANIGIDDGTDIVEIDLKDADFYIGETFVDQTGRLKFPNEYQKGVMSRYILKKKPFGLSLETRFTETIIKEGTEVYVQGKVRAFADSRLIFKNIGRIVIFPLDKKHLLNTYKANIVLSIFGIVIGVVIIVLFI